MRDADERTGASLSVVIAGGGTGGHLFPGIAVAREIARRRPGARVTFAGTARGLEARVVPAEGFELDVIRSAGLKGKSIVATLRGVALVPAGLVDAWRIISRRRPNVVVGVGGYSAGPVVLAAALRGRPTLVLEQNAVPGLTNRMLAPWVRAAAVTYDEAVPFFRGRAIVTGNPVRAEFFAIGDGAAGARRANGPRRILIVGGSQGAHVVNMAAVAAAPELVRRFPDLEIVHQTGARDLDAVRKEYERGGIAARAAAFFDPLAGEMKDVDLVIARAGATSIAELQAAGRPALLVPFASAADDHQRANARVLVDKGAAAMIEETALSGPALAASAGALLADTAWLASASAAMRAMARPDAATKIVDRLLELAR
jgi:UDP-N-acetylglucosamine--N-acetylmuramyl-(pentapeptide) pyrophosphoryl-undecaprenol N-acetylglucosamine transferase